MQSYLSSAFLLPAMMLLAGCGSPADGPAGSPRPDVTAISTIQGHGDRSPLEGREVWIEGVIIRKITAPVDDATGEEPVHGWWVQEAGDGDPAAEDAVFVRTTTWTLEILADEVTSRIGNTVRPGDRVAISGNVVELPSSAFDDIEPPIVEAASSRTLTAVEALTIEVVP